MSSNNNLPSISVVVPFYNSIDYVLNAIRYLKYQTFDSFEVILVDDGSEDKRKLDVEVAIRDDERFYLITQIHSGAGEARNYGLKLAKGKYIIFLDADDKYDRCLLEKLFLSATKWNSDIALCNATSEGNASWSVLRVAHLRCERASKEELKDEIFQISSPAPWNKLIRTSLVRKNGIKFLTIQNSNDLTFTYSALARAEMVSWVDEPLIQYSRSNPASIQKQKDKNPENIVLALEGLLKNLERYDNFDQLRISFLKMVQDTVLWNIKTFKGNKSREKLLKCFVESRLYSIFSSSYLRQTHEEFSDFYKKIEILRSSFCISSEESNSNDSAVRIGERRRFTIVIPFFNDENFIKIPIESLKKQTYQNFNVILINDGSFDASKERAAECISGDQRFKIFDQKNMGLSLSRNFGLSIANSDYVLFLDSDDALVPECLEKLNQCIELNNPDLIFFEAKSINYYSEQNKFSRNRCAEMNKFYARRGEYQGVLTGPQVMHEAYFFNEFIPSACLSVSKLSFLIKNSIKFIPKILHEDNPYTFEILLKAQRVKVLKEKFYLRSVRPESITTTDASVRNVWGYYISYIKSQELLRSDTARRLIDEDQAYAFQNVSLNFLRKARDLWRNVKDKEYFLLFLNKEERLLFEETMSVSSKSFDEIILSKKELTLINFKRKIFQSVRKILNGFKVS